VERIWASTSLYCEGRANPSSTTVCCRQLADKVLSAQTIDHQLAEVIMKVGMTLLKLLLIVSYVMRMKFN
jgi:hypothetical protein